MSTSDDKGQRPEPADADENGMSCDQARRQIERLIADCDLRDIERSLLQAHVRNCRPCKAELDRYRRLEARLKAAFAPLDTAPHFSARVLAVLPEAGTAEAPKWEKTRTTRHLLISGKALSPYGANGRRPGEFSVFRFVYAAGLAALLTLCVAGLAYFCYWWRHSGQTYAELPGYLGSQAQVTAVQGQAELVREGSGTALLAAGEKLRPQDSIRATAQPVSLTLNCGPRRTTTVALAARSRLEALNRNSYKLTEGAAYFQVRNEPPKAAPNEVLEVDAAGIATVKVTGTTFGVDLASAAQGGVVVFVEEGTVQVEPHGQAPVLVAAGQELAVAPGGLPSLPQALNKSARRTAWLAELNPPAKGQPLTYDSTVVENARAPGAVAVAPEKSLNWDLPVRDVPLLDRNLAEGIDLLAAGLGRPPQLLQLGSQLQGPFIANNATLNFSVHGEMPLQAVLRWMARDVSMRFVLGAEGKPRFSTAAADEPLGPAACGTPPEDVRKALEAPCPQSLKSSVSLRAAAEILGTRCGVSIILDRALLEKQAATHSTNGDLPGQTVAQKLEALLSSLHANAAWYDHALYVAAPARIEALTYIERTAALNPELLGSPPNAAWATALQELLAAQTYPSDEYASALAAPGQPGLQLRSDTKLSGHPLFGAAALDLKQADAPALCYRTGSLGAAELSALLGLIQTGSAVVPGTSGMISQITPGVVPDLKSLAEQVRPPLRVALAPGLKPLPFDKQAFVNKNLPLGEALEWAAWLSGCGLRQDNNDVWVVDEAAACYGPPAWQVLSLAQLAARHPAVAPALPGLFARLLPELYPDFFARTECRCIGNRLVFRGDRRQLQLAQRLYTALEACNPANLKEIHKWKPHWRETMETSLAEPFRCAEPILSGSFAGLLRQQGELNHQLRCTILVDPVAMREKAGVEIHQLDVSGFSVEKVVERLAREVGLRMVLEGDVVWLRP
ncbi:MAG: FecR family protein [Planctomycetota bacterium]